MPPEDRTRKPMTRVRFMRNRRWRVRSRVTVRTPAERRAALILALVCLAVSYFFLHVLVDVAGHTTRALAASWAGRGDGAGMVTITGKTRTSGRSSGFACWGDFTPEHAGPVRTGLRVHVHSCTPGDRVAVELVRGSPDSWNSASRVNQAYERGAGWAGNLIVTIFIGGFCLVLGLLFAIGGIAVLIGVLRPASRRPRGSPPSIRKRLGHSGSR